METICSAARRVLRNGQLLVTKSPLITVANADLEKGAYHELRTLLRILDEYLPNAGDWEIGLIGSVQAFLVLSCSLIVGRLIDAQLHRCVVLVGGVLTTLGHLCLSFTSH